MPLDLDSEIATALAQRPGGFAPPTSIDAMRAQAAVMADATAHNGLPATLTRSVTSVPGPSGHTVEVRWTAPRRTGREAPGPAVLHIHGGGMVAGSAAMFDPVIAAQVTRTGVPHLSVEYGLAPERSGTGPAEDCWAALQWLASSADELGVDPQRIGLFGDSSGGGLAAATALLARDRGGPQPSAQILIYPMLDDRTVEPDTFIEPHASWTYAANRMGWTALLGERLGGTDVSYYEAPARCEDLTGLPPTYLEVGTLDIFRDEDIRYAQRLLTAGVQTELHVHPGAPHGFANIAPHAAVAQRALADRDRRISAL